MPDIRPGDVFTRKMVNDAKAIMAKEPDYKQATVIDAQIIRPEMERINKVTGQQNLSRYFAYMLIHYITISKV